VRIGPFASPGVGGRANHNLHVLYAATPRWCMQAAHEFTLAAQQRRTMPHLMFAGRPLMKLMAPQPEPSTTTRGRPVFVVLSMS
jgi:hypothetical protein